jgi:tyrosine-protein kinase Etk/Wzc
MEENKKLENSKDVVVGGTFVEFLTVIVRYRWFLFLFVFLITVGATSYALLAPKWYEATASVLPAENTDILSALSGLSSLTKGFSATKGLAALTKSNNESDRYIAILKSATVTDTMINKFGLRKEYEMEGDYYIRVVKEWKANMSVELQDEGNLSISVLDKNPQKAAEMANFLVQKLNDLNTELSIKNARANREFIEKRYRKNLKDIDSLELAMKDYQTKTGIIAIPEQIESTIKSMSTIYGEYLLRDVELSALKRQLGNDNPKIDAARFQVEELGKKISQLNAGIDNSQKDSKFIIPFKQAPELANGYLRIYKDLQIQYKILEIVTPLYESAKVEEVKNMPSVIVLDHAFAPDRKAKPKGTVFASVSFVTSLLVGFLIVFTLELFRKIKLSQPEKYRYITGWMKFRKTT